MVEIIQNAKACSMKNPDCLEHPNRAIGLLCMKCKVGLCSKCFISSAAKQHSDHQLLEIDDAFAEIKKTCDALVEKGKETCQVLLSESQAIQDKRSKIESATKTLQAACASKNLSVFDMKEKLSELLETSTSNKEHGAIVNPISQGQIADRNCTPYTFQRASDGLGHGKSIFEHSKVEYEGESIALTKLASVAVLVDALHLKLNQAVCDGVAEVLEYLWDLCYESEPCCRRVVLQGGVDLLVSFFEFSVTDVKICRVVLGVFGSLAKCYSLHNYLMSTSTVNMLVYCIQKFTMAQSEIPFLACESLSCFLCSTSSWPEKCASREELSTLVIDNCKKFPLNVQCDDKLVSLRHYVYLMSQQGSQAAKYYAASVLHQYVHSQPEHHCPKLVRAGGLSVFKQQHSAPQYVLKLIREILTQVKEYTHTSFIVDIS